MVTYRGYKTVVKYDDETSYGSGTVGASSVVKGRIQSLTINENNNIIRTVAMGEGRNEVFEGWGNYDCTWSMEYEVSDFDFLRYAIGSMAGTGSTAAPKYLQEEEFMDYTAGADSGMKSFYFDVGFQDVSGGTHEDHTLNGVIMNNVSFTLALGSTLRASIDGFAQKSTASTGAISLTADTTKPWIFAQGDFKWNSSTVGRVTNCTLTIANNFDPEAGRELGSRFIQAAEPGLRKYDWTITVKMTSAIATTMRDHFYGQANTPNEGIDPSEPTLYALILQLAEGAVSGDRQAGIYLSDCFINDISKPVNIGDNIVELTINGGAKKGTNRYNQSSNQVVY